MIIDFRLRPPVGRAAESQLFVNVAGLEKRARFRGMEHAPSLRSRKIEDTMNEMDAAGVTIGVMAARLGNAGMGDVLNEDVEAAVAMHPDRFIGFASIAGDTLMDTGAAQVEKWAKGKVFRGLSLEPGTWPGHLYYDDRRLYPVYEACVASDWPVMFTGGRAGPDQTYTNPIAMEHVATDFPKLKIIAAHGAWPWVHLILSVCWSRENIYLLPDCFIYKMAGWRDYVDAGHGFLQDRMLFGSAYPILPIGPSVAGFKALFEESLLQRLMYDNAARLLKLSK